MENDIPSKWKPKDGEAILVSNKRDFKPKVVMKIKGYSIMVKKSPYIKKLEQSLIYMLPTPK